MQNALLTGTFVQREHLKAVSDDNRSVSNLKRNTVDRFNHVEVAKTCAKRGNCRLQRLSQQLTADARVTFRIPRPASCS